MPKLRTVQTDVLLRALAISMVAFHHSHAPEDYVLGLAGGMTFLMMLSGMNLARFALSGATESALRLAIVKFARRIFVPTLLAVLFAIVVRGRVNWLELVFLKNWTTELRVAFFPDWYPNLLVQILLGLYVLACIPRVAAAAIARPALSSLLLFLVAVVVRAIGPRLWDTEHLDHRLPHLFLWNFTLGWVVYFFSRQPGRPHPVSARAVAVLCILAGSAVAWSPARLEFWWLIAGGLLLVMVQDVKVPSALAQAVSVVSGATFAIFIWHAFWFKNAIALYRTLVDANGQPHAHLVFVFGMLMSVASWVAFTALVRAYRSVRGLAPAPVSVT